MEQVTSDTLDLKTSRRTACGLIAGAAAVSLADFSARAAGSVSSDMVPHIIYVLSDKRISESMLFADILSGRGAIVLEVTEGMTRLWRESLEPLWRAGGGGVAGLTRRATWEGVVEQARSHRRRSVFAGLHALSSDGFATEHSLTGPSAILASVAVPEVSRQAWPLTMASLALSCLSPNPRAAVKVNLAGPAKALRSACPSKYLASWVIA